MVICSYLAVWVYVYLLSSQHHRDHTLWLSGLGALVNQDGAELHLGQTRITSPNAGTTDNISILHKEEGAGIQW